ncbi:hypothetical protein Ddye_010078 [Dipteronia dyeriana]|uniref:Small auxin up regulated protein n=1 Tax=Dipteronia dyeriana TaxID=168575 RepID=A0AAE0CMX9_9ROSI|nr:hypothetical protein Ddye_010078 [Dipteronia dyeriana]
MVVKKSENKVSHQTAGSLKQIFKRCSSFGRIHVVDDEVGTFPYDVPRGHFVVYVGESRSRYICPISWLSHPHFKCLLRKSEEEFGFRHNMGLTIPCEESVFRSLTAVMMNHSNQ